MKTSTRTWWLTLGIVSQAVAGCAVPTGDADAPDPEGVEQTSAALISGQTNFVRNDYLLPGQQLVSTGCGFTLDMQADGNLVLYRRNVTGGPTATWFSNTVGSGNRFMTMQGDGNMVVYNSSLGAAFHTHTNGNPGAFLTPQWDGNLVVYRSDNAALWVSHTNQARFTRTVCPFARSFVHVDHGRNRNGAFLDVVQVTGPNAVIVGKECAAACSGRSSCRSFNVVTAHTGPAIDFFGRCTLLGDAVASVPASTGAASGIVCRFTSAGALAASHSLDCVDDAARQL